MSWFRSTRSRAMDGMQGSLLTPTGVNASASSTSTPTPPARPGGKGSMFTQVRSSLRSALSRRRPREGGQVGSDAALRAAHQAECQRWAAERQMLLTDCTTMRAEAHALTERLDGWSSLVRDLFFYGGLHDRVDQITHFLCARLRESVGEIDGVTEVDVSELRLPSSSEYAPELSLLRYCGPELSEWRVRWDPPPAQAACSIMLHGRKFGVTFTIVVSITAFHLHGELQCCCSGGGDGARARGARTLRVGFKRLPEIAFEIALQSERKVLSLGTDTLRAWLARQLEKTLRARAVLPNAIEVPLPGSAGRGDSSAGRGDSSGGGGGSDGGGGNDGGGGGGYGGAGWSAQAGAAEVARAEWAALTEGEGAEAQYLEGVEALYVAPVDDALERLLAPRAKSTGLGPAAAYRCRGPPTRLLRATPPGPRGEEPSRGCRGEAALFLVFRGLRCHSLPWPLQALRTETSGSLGPAWLLDEVLARALGAPLSELRQRRPASGSSSGSGSGLGSGTGGASRPRAPTDAEWGTTLVLAVLQLRYHAHMGRWAPLVEARRSATLADLMRSGMEVACELHLAG